MYPTIFPGLPVGNLQAFICANFIGFWAVLDVYIGAEYLVSAVGLFVQV